MKKLIFLILLFVASFMARAQTPDFHFNSVVIGTFSSDPVTGFAGQIYWNDISLKFRKHNGTDWSDLDAVLSIATIAEINAGIVDNKAISPNGFAGSDYASNIATNNAKVGVTDEISNVIEDLTPQLGGNLDFLNRKLFTSTTNGNLLLEANGTGNVQIGTDFNFELLSGDLLISELASGDPKIILTDPSFNSWTFGSDDSASTFTIDNGISLGILPPFSIHHGTQVTTLNSATSGITQLVLNQNGLGDSSMSFGVVGDTYSMGIDNDDTDSFKLSYNATIGINDVLRVDTPTLGITAPSMSIGDIDTLGNPALITKEYADANYSGSGLSNIVEDTTPQLGGTLDTQGNVIQNLQNFNQGMTSNGGFQFDVDADDNADIWGFLVRKDASVNMLEVKEDGTALLGNTEIADITSGGAKSIITKEYADANYSGSGLNNIVEDITPQLGGALDVNGQEIISNGNVSVQIDDDNNTSGVAEFNVFRDGGATSVFKVNELGITTVSTLSNGSHQSLGNYQATINGRYLAFVDTQYIVDLDSDNNSTSEYFLIKRNNSAIGTQDLFKVIEDGTITAPQTTNALITTAGNKALITKEYGDANYTAVGSQALEVLDEGNGDGIAIAGRTSANYGNLGLRAFDISYYASASATHGATGQQSFAGGSDIQNSSTSGFYYGTSSTLAGSNNGGMGYGNTISGFGSFGFGTYLDITGNGTGDSGAAYNFSTGIENRVEGDGVTAQGVALDAEGNGLNVFGTANIIRANSFIRDNPTDQLFVVGNGTTDANHQALVRSNALEILKNGNMTSYGDVTIQNNDTSTTANLLLDQDGTGDAFQTITAGGTSYSFGVDNSDSDIFKFATGTDLTTNPAWRIGDAGNEMYFDVNNLYHFANRSLNTTGLALFNDGTGDIRVSLGAGGVTWAFGVDQSDTEAFKLTVGNDPSSGTNVFRADSSTGDILFNAAIQAQNINLTGLNVAPASSSDTGTAGQIKVTEDYIYVCTATNTWKRVALSTW